MNTNILVIFSILLIGISKGQGADYCILNEGNAAPSDFVDMQEACTQAVQDQIQMEMDASMGYLAMAAHFSKDTVNRPGFATLFFKSASEEREHGAKLIEYLLMRGKLTEKYTDLIKPKVPAVTSWPTGVSALKKALEMEVDVTRSIRELIKTCEDDAKFNDYHLVDYLTSVYLEEQYHGQREIAGRVSTLNKMMNDQNAALAEFLYDKKLLE